MILHREGINVNTQRIAKVNVDEQASVKVDWAVLEIVKDVIRHAADFVFRSKLHRPDIMFAQRPLIECHSQRTDSNGTQCADPILGCQSSIHALIEVNNTNERSDTLQLASG